MKFSFAIACLLGLASAEMRPSNFIALSQHRPHYRTHAQVESESESESSDSESDSDEERAPTFGAAVGLEAQKVIDKNPIWNAWESVKDGAPDGHYERVVTFNFATDTDDLFMRSMITNYAHEQRTAIEQLDDGTRIGGEPTGSFWMSRSDMMRAAKEVMRDHKGLSGEALSDYSTHTSTVHGTSLTSMARERSRSSR